MKWKVEYTKTFLKELAQLPKEIQSRGEEISIKASIGRLRLKLTFPDTDMNL